MGATPAISPFPIHLSSFSTSYRSAPSLPLYKIPIQNPKSPKFPRFKLLAESGNPNPSNGGRDSLEEEMKKGDPKKERRRPPQFNLRWRDLLDPDPENIVAVGLTGLLTWASVQVLWQLLFISVAIILAALKYSFIAALLLFILITLL